MGKYLKKEDGVENQKQGDISFIAGNWPLDIARPTIIFLHGAALSKNLWAAQVAALANIANTMHPAPYRSRGAEVGSPPGS